MVVAVAAMHMQAAEEYTVVAVENNPEIQVEHTAVARPTVATGYIVAVADMVMKPWPEAAAQLAA